MRRPAPADVSVLRDVLFDFESDGVRKHLWQASFNAGNQFQNWGWDGAYLAVEDFAGGSGHGSRFEIDGDG